MQSQLHRLGNVGKWLAATRRWGLARGAVRRLSLAGSQGGPCAYLLCGWPKQRATRVLWRHIVKCQA